ncbi:MAG: hypothetical protein U9R17_13550 [Thermodesulfobacteriota bacterium]|nr:hypothetical protein [Thermodesulfobacteriota bacterium]
MQNIGILKHKLNTKTNEVTATFDNEKTSAEQIIKHLSKGGYPVSGKPQYIE